MRCSSCRFAALYFAPFCGGLVESGRLTGLYLALGAVYWLAHSAGIEITNRLADRTEDAINRPERTELCELVGWRTLETAQVAIWAGVLILDAVWIALAANALLIGLLSASVALGVVYSRGARLSRSRAFAPLTLNLLFGGAFLLGWSLGDPLHQPHDAGLHQLPEFLPMLVVVGLFVLALAGIKDITDREGDLRVGYRSLFVDLIDRPSSLLATGVAGLPFGGLAAFVVSGLLPPRMALLLAFVPCSAILLAATRRAHTDAEKLLIREIFYGYWLAFSSAALLLYLRSPALAAAIGATVAYWACASRWLHWSPAPGRAGLMLVLRISGLGSGRGVEPMPEGLSRT
jgi:4-hydroxybenzoate polyprenyltransferase